MFRFNLKYFIITVVLFIAEFAIAAYVHDRFIRPYFGDSLVSIFVYCAVKSFFDTPVGSTAVGVLLFSYIVEFTQYFHLVDVIGLGNSAVACAIMGTHFSFTDMLMYTLGIILVLFLEMYFNDDMVKANI
ncbi:DUF2809 domain-containing protein [Mucilaginibacter sp. HMF5004]|uniref:ribosomal maturation YjgA family protein n=1 Tax=Mucilaginibacter rivuli TaxID=2857527 RepID=UPI001C5E3160|nr:DUF2809 domain-containing protein [Mucilaginibacter rivuli]MBW4890677.1 DUF2809 domain-containing protein [Mucilaginibacter rivuli]